MLPKVSFVVPTYNERFNIGGTLEGIWKAFQSIPHEIIVVDDCSPDGTGEAAEEMTGGIPSLKVCHRKGEKGFGYALQKGFELATGELIIVTMGDSSDSPQDMLHMYECAVEQNLDVVYTSRFIEGGGSINYPLLKKSLNRVYNKLISLIFGMPFNDSTGGFKLYSKKLIEKIKPDRGDFDINIQLAIQGWKKGKRFAEIPVVFDNRRKYGKTKFNVMKVCWMYLIGALRELYRRKP